MPQLIACRQHLSIPALYSVLRPRYPDPPPAAAPGEAPIHRLYPAIAIHRLYTAYTPPLCCAVQSRLVCRAVQLSSWCDNISQ